MTSLNAMGLKAKLPAEFDIPVQLDLRERSADKVPARIQRVNMGFFQLSLPVHLQRDTMLDVVFAHQRIQVEVVYCKAAEGDGYSAGVRLTAGLYGAVRREPRIPLNFPATVNCAASGVTLSGRVVDMSRSGLGLVLPVSVPVGAGISVELDCGIAFGEVRHCRTKSKDGWSTGVLLEEFISLGEEKDERLRSTEPTSAPNRLTRTLNKIFGR